MGAQSIVHGRIVLRDSFAEARDFIKSLENDNTFPFLRTEMFSFGAYDRPFYYDEPIIAFGATYKSVEYDWAAFVIKFEEILRNLNFVNAKIQLETEICGTYNFTWIKKQTKGEFDIEEKLVEMEDWFFGYGFRNFWGRLIGELAEQDIFSIDFEYPIRFDGQVLKDFNSLIESNEFKEINSKVYVNDYIKYRKDIYEKTYPILIYLKIKKYIDFTFESGKGYVLTKLKDIKQIESPYN